MVISGERVKQARELKGMTQTALAKAVGVSQAAIAQLESGAFMGSDELLQEISSKTGLPVKFFTQDPAQEFPVGSLLFRSHKSMTKREMTTTYRNAQIARDSYIQLRSRLKSITTKIPKLSSDDPMQAARQARRALGLSATEPVPHLLNLLEWNGVVAVVVPHIKASEAFSLWIDETPFLAVSSGRSGDRARFSVAHELGHLVMHAGKSRFAVDDAEADDFGGEFLMPEVQFKKEVRPPVTLASLAELKPRWRVSIQAMIYWSKEIGIITDRQYRYLFEQLSSMGWRKREPIEITPEKPRAFRQMLEMLYGDPIDVRAAANDLAIDPKRLQDMLPYFASKADTTPPALPSNVVSFAPRA